MKNRIALCVGTLTLVLGFARLALADSFTFTNIDFPGAIESAAAGINNSGQIVGGYEAVNGSRHGFLYTGGTFTTVDDPSATSGTEAIGINNLGQIVGAYDLNPPETGHVFEGKHGFRNSGGTFRAIDYPAMGVTSTTPEKINDSAGVVGVYRFNGPGNGFLYSGGIYSTVNFPGGFGTHNNGINNAGEIVGQYKDSPNGSHHGFLDNGGTFTTINFPGAAETWGSDINTSGDIVGFYKSSGGAPFGFLLKGGNFTPIAFPGAIATEVVGINDQGNIVGIYADQNSVIHGFLATPTGTASPGTFVIGDRNAVVGNRVTFWGAQWAQFNSLSGGPAPASFKGFANATSQNPPACRGAWASNPGNSSGPPTSVPSYITVIAASSITQSGSGISGNIPETVTVKTDPGYVSDPGHAGTGTVVSIVCH